MLPRCLKHRDVGDRIWHSLQADPRPAKTNDGADRQPATMQWRHLVVPRFADQLIYTTFAFFGWRLFQCITDIK
jgi:hypothetical protein